jgi:putative ABC transport system ATP-binding protein
MIHCEGLVKIYRTAGREVVALQGLELAVAAGEVLAIVGPSGAGKSTLLNVLGGLDRPSAGQAWVNGHNLAELPESALDRYRREAVGFVWQQPGRNLIGYLTALENVMLPMRLARVPARRRRGRATELLVAVGLDKRVVHLPTQLSGGEQQRVAIAVALANGPRLLLADEPTGELDSVTAREIYTLFHELVERYPLTIIIVSHDPNITSYVDRVVTIRDGKTSTETVKVVSPVKESTSADLPGTEDDVRGLVVNFSEYVVVDSVGRLQIPADLCEEYAIAGRVRLTRHPDGVLIQPET